MAYTQSYTLFDTTSAHSTTLTSNAVFVGDFTQLSVQVDAVTTSSISLQGSNDDGFSASVGTWSAITGIISAGVYAIDPGFRWLRGVRGSSNSTCGMWLEGKQQR